MTMDSIGLDLRAEVTEEGPVGDEYRVVLTMRSLPLLSWPIGRGDAHVLAADSGRLLTFVRDGVAEILSGQQHRPVIYHLGR